MREITPDDVKRFCEEQQTVEGLKYNLNHMGRLFLQSESVVIEERTKHIELQARYEFVLNANKGLAAKIKAVELENARLSEQNGRQAKTIEEADGHLASLVKTVERMTLESQDRQDVLKTCRASLTRLVNEDAEKDIALANAHARIKYLQGELARVTLHAKTRSAWDALAASGKPLFVPEPGQSYEFKPTVVEVFGGDRTMSYVNPTTVILTF